MTSSDASRAVLLMPHMRRPEAVEATRQAVAGLSAVGITARILASDAPVVADLHGLEVVNDDEGAADCELIIVLGGDGTILRGAEYARRDDVPLLGLNLGHMGFLAESERDDLPSVIDAVVNRAYTVENRMTCEVEVKRPDGSAVSNWCLNDVTIEKTSRGRMIEVISAVDDRPVSEWACDGIICATPTGSTAYAFSAGGPVMWPDVEALLVVPISAHALFNRPLVVSPHSRVEVRLLEASEDAVVWCDGRRTADLVAGSRVTMRRSGRDVLFARLHRSPFTDRLVGKFQLPVAGWRSRKPESAS